MGNNLKLLKTVSCDNDADIILAKLRSENIIGIKKYSESAAAAKLYCGASSIGVDIYVWNAAFDRALEIISDCEFSDDELSELAIGTDAPQDNEAYTKTIIKKIAVYTAVIVFILVLLKIIMH